MAYMEFSGPRRIDDLLKERNIELVGAEAHGPRGFGATHESRTYRPEHAGSCARNLAGC